MTEISCKFGVEYWRSGLEFPTQKYSRILDHHQNIYHIYIWYKWLIYSLVTGFLPSLSHYMQIMEYILLFNLFWDHGKRTWCRNHITGFQFQLTHRSDLAQVLVSLSPLVSSSVTWEW